MTVAAEMLAAMVTAMTVTAVVTMIKRMTMMRILRILHRRNYSTTIIATTTLSRWH